MATFENTEREEDYEVLQANTPHERTQLLLAKMRETRQFETQNDPCFPTNPTRRVPEDSNPSTEELHPRLCNTQWCSCGNCDIMPTVKECLCCREKQIVVDIIEPGTKCIVESPFFISQCLNEDKVYFNLRLVKNFTKRPSDDDYHRYLRMTAYRTFTIWVHEFLGKKKRTPVPACVVKAIRTVFPDSFGLYRGFIPLEDYSAVDMAFDLV